MGYIESSKILVFPSAQRGQRAEFIDARLTTETAIANIINKLIDTDGFIITELSDWNSSTNYNPTVAIEFNLYGYYFRVHDPSSIFDEIPADATKIYAAIALHKVVTHETGRYRYELFGQDDDDLGVYKGIQFNTEPVYEGIEMLPADCELKFLELFVKDSQNRWILSDESAFKYHKKSLDFDVDGGEII